MGAKPTGVLCEVLPGGEIRWDEVGLQVAGMESARAATEAVAKYRRKRQ